MVRSPRRPRNMSSGPTHIPIVPTVSCRRGQVAALAATVPSITSEWPPIYLVPDWIESRRRGRAAEEERARPGVVHQHDRALGMRRRGDRRDVLHLEGERARCFGEHSARIRLHQKGDAIAGARIVIGRRHAVARQHGVAECARRAVDAVGHQQVVAGLQHREQRDRNRREAGGRDRTPAHAGPSMSRSAFSRASEVGVPRRPYW